MSPLDKFILEQNYPNPFNPVTIISFTLPKETQTKLEVFDITGEGVTMIINKVVEAGYHSVEFDAGNQNSGIYFYRISTPRYSEVKNMILLK